MFRWLKDNGFLRGLQPGTFAARGAHFLSQLNAIHAFREGNGRAENAFFALLAAEAGHPIAFERAQPAAFLGAMVHSFGTDTHRLEAQILDLIT